MCGIAGMVGLPSTAEVRDRMLHTMARRGPDAEGSYLAPEVTLLHRRLAVIDPEGGKQPMELEWAGETYVIVYNGELYNTWELRQELLKAGHCFVGHSDTEVLLHAYAQWGAACPERCNGIFAFAVWEKRKRRLFLARDRMGVKPLFYMHHQGGFLFGSEIKTLLAYPMVRARLDPQGAAELLLLGPGRTPGCGVFQGIEELLPGFRGIYADGKLTTDAYWQLRDQPHTESFEETVEHTRQLVLDAIHRQMISDVPIGTFLSGGLDSSIITAVCAREMGREGKRLKTFSVDYAGNDRFFTPSKFQPNADGEYIRLMQKTLQTDHHWCVLQPQQLVDALEEAVLARDLPGMADVDISLLLFCRQIRKEVTVALSGECADEIFGGYPWFRDPQIRDRTGFPWAQNTAERLSMASPELRPWLSEDYVDLRYTETCRQTCVLPDTSSQERRMKQMGDLNRKWFMQTLLDRKDRMSMWSSLEVRVPFCDHRIAEYLYSVPWEFKDHGGKEKGLLRCAMEGLLPQEVLWRKKSPYPKTHDPVYLHFVSARLNALLTQKDAPLFSMVSRESAQNLLTAEREWPWYGQLMKVPQTICYLLQMDFWLRHYNVELLW